MGAVLDVARRPEPLGRAVVALVEERIEGFENEGSVVSGCGHHILPRKCELFRRAVQSGCGVKLDDLLRPERQARGRDVLFQVGDPERAGDRQDDPAPVQ